MKTLLNLLPEENKKNIQRKLHFRFFLWQLFLICMLEVFYLGILVSIFIILDYQLQSLQSMSPQSVTAYADQQALGTYQKKFKETNIMVEMVGRIERAHFSFTQILTILDSLLPEGIAVEQLTTKNYTILLSGRAAKRDDILAFESKLNDTPCVTNVDLPLSNLFSQENVDFQINFDMQKECLQKNNL